MADWHDVFLWITVAYIFVLNLLAAFVAWTLWIWRDGLMTPEETSEVMMGPLLTLGPFAVLLDLAIGLVTVRLLRRRAKGDSSSSAGE